MRELKNGRPSPAMIVALIALCMSMTGAGYAASQITGKQIKNSSVTGKDIKDNSLTGSDITESKLAKVPSAGTADNATTANNAGNANHAATADNIGGQTIKKIYFNAPINTPTTTVFEGGGLKITADCDSTWDIHLIASTTKQNSSIYGFLRGDDNENATDEDDFETNAFNVGTNFDLLQVTSATANTTGNVSYVEFTYAATDGSVATGTIQTDENHSPKSCQAYGHVTVG